MCITPCSWVCKDASFRLTCPSIFKAKEWLVWLEYEGRMFLLSFSFHALKYTVSRLWRQWKSTIHFPFSMNLWPITNIVMLYWNVVYSEILLIFIKSCRKFFFSLVHIILHNNVLLCTHTTPKSTPYFSEYNLLCTSKRKVHPETDHKVPERENEVWQYIFFNVAPYMLPHLLYNPTHALFTL